MGCHSHVAATASEALQNGAGQSGAEGLEARERAEEDEPRDECAPPFRTAPGATANGAAAASISQAFEGGERIGDGGRGGGILCAGAEPMVDQVLEREVGAVGEETVGA